MALDQISEELRTQDKFHHIDIGFLNKRLCITALFPRVREYFREAQKPGTDHFTELSNAHLLITMLLDCCREADVPTLLKALTLGKPRHLFCSTERLEPCPEIYHSGRVCHGVRLDIDFGKPVVIAYHTSHIISDTSRMALARGADENHLNSIVGRVHDKGDRFEIEPLVIGSPWFDHPRNGEDSLALMWAGDIFGEVLAEDIDQFSRMREVAVKGPEGWMEVMRDLPEDDVKRAITGLLNEPAKKDWGGESNDHFSASISLGGQRRTAAFLLKGPSPFREMTLEMCGKRADQIHRMVDSGAEVCVVQHSHLIGPVVRRTLRTETIQPGSRRRKYCLMDGQVTYRILKAYSLL